MSDQTNPGGGDFRGSAADKRKDETVMVNADDLSNLVSSARQEPPAPVAPVAPPAAPTPVGSSGKGIMVVVVAGALGILAVFVAILLITYLGGR